jgi:hypothetical protein
LPSTRGDTVATVTRPVSQRFAVLFASAAVLAIPAFAPAAASAASLGLDQRCYVAGEQAGISGSGFLANTNVNLTRGTDPLTAVTSDNSGAMRSKFLVPDVAPGLVESQVSVSATDGTTTAQAQLNIAKVGATFTPQTGNLKTLRVAHVISGFGLSELAPSIYLHYVSPEAQQVPATTTKPTATKTAVATTTKTTAPAGGSALTNGDPAGVKTIRLGKLRGPCGVLRTSPRKLFPFKTTSGKWLLQYDTRPKYTKGSTSSTFLWVATRVTIKG